MRKIKIGFYTHHWDYAGTARSHEQIATNLNRGLFEPVILYWPGGDNSRLPYLESVLGKDSLIPFSRTKDKTGSDKGYAPVVTDFKEICQNASIDILHVARSGYYEWPLTDRICPVQVETKIFADKDPRTYVDWSFPIADFVSYDQDTHQTIIPNPIPSSIQIKDPQSFRGVELPNGIIIKDTDTVYGRIGRPAGWTPHGTIGFTAAMKANPNSYFLIVAPCPEDRAFYSTEEFKDRVIYFEPTYDDNIIQRFFNTLDVFLHYRSDGEVCSVAIGQAMANRLPVVSHRSQQFNGQVGMLADVGFVASSEAEYSDMVIRLAKDESLRKTTGLAAYTKYTKEYLPSVVLRRYEDEYIRLYQEKGLL
jgi:hypothetical protein